MKLEFVFFFAFFISVKASALELNETDSIRISLLEEFENATLGMNITEKDKNILRYGFHNTYDCQDFNKAFICIRKCLDLNYQIAHADKSCICTCYKNQVLAQYKRPINKASTKWKLGAPTTSKPAWAGPPDVKPMDYEINAGDNTFIEDPTEEPVNSEEPEEEGGNNSEEVSGTTDGSPTDPNGFTTATGV